MKADILEAYKGKKVFVTGHTGFKGSWMSVWLHQLGAITKGYALAPENDSLYPLIEKEIGIESEIADIRDAERLKKSILDFQPDFIFHMAAQPLVLYSYQHPVETFEVNTLGTAHLLDAVRALEKKCSVVVITTDKVYENHEWVYPYRETDALGGYDPYSASKAAAEIVTASYRSSFFNPAKYALHKKGIATARAGNVIGGGDFAKDRLVPDIVRALSEGQEIIIRNPDSIRPWQHVLEPLWGYFLLGLALDREPEKFSTGFNFGPESSEELSVKMLVEKSINFWGNGKYSITTPQNLPHEAHLLKLDTSKAKRLLLWNPEWNCSKGLEKTIRWYKRYSDSMENAVEFCKEDIRQFCETTHE